MTTEETPPVDPFPAPEPEPEPVKVERDPLNDADAWPWPDHQSWFSEPIASPMTRSERRALVKGHRLGQPSWIWKAILILSLAGTVLSLQIAGLLPAADVRLVAVALGGSISVVGVIGAMIWLRPRRRRRRSRHARAGFFARVFRGSGSHV